MIAQAIIYVNTRRKVDFLLDKMTSRDFTVSALVSARQELGHFRIAIRKAVHEPNVRDDRYSGIRIVDYHAFAAIQSCCPLRCAEINCELR